MLTYEQESSLTSRGDNFDHHHSSDRVMTQDSLHQLHQIARVSSQTSPYTLSEKDDIVMLPLGGIIILPEARNGGEFEVIMSGTAVITIQLSGSDLIYGETSVIMNTQGTALRFKAISGGWVII